MDKSITIVPNTSLATPNTAENPQQSSQENPQEFQENPDTSVKQEQVQEQAPKEAPKKPKAPKELEKALVKLGKYVKSYQKNLKFYVDETDGEMMVFLFDTEKDVLIKKMSPKEAFEIVGRLDKEGKTNLVNKEI